MISLRILKRDFKKILDSCTITKEQFIEKGFKENVHARELNVIAANLRGIEKAREEMAFYENNIYDIQRSCKGIFNHDYVDGRCTICLHEEEKITESTGDKMCGNCENCFLDEVDEIWRCGEHFDNNGKPIIANYGNICDLYKED